MPVLLFGTIASKCSQEPRDNAASRCVGAVVTSFGPVVGGFQHPPRDAASSPGPHKLHVHLAVADTQPLSSDASRWLYVLWLICWSHATIGRAEDARLHLHVPSLCTRQARMVEGRNVAVQSGTPSDPYLATGPSFWKKKTPESSCHGEQRRSQSANGQAPASVTTATMRLKSTVIGGSTTNFLAELMKNKNKGKTPQNERCASAVGIRFAHSSCKLRSPIKKSVRAK